MIHTCNECKFAYKLRHDATKPLPAESVLTKMAAYFAHYLLICFLVLQTVLLVCSLVLYEVDILILCNNGNVHKQFFRSHWPWELPNAPLDQITGVQNYARAARGSWADGDWGQWIDNVWNGQKAVQWMFLTEGFDEPDVFRCYYAWSALVVFVVCEVWLLLMNNFIPRAATVAGVLCPYWTRRCYGRFQRCIMVRLYGFTEEHADADLGLAASEILWAQQESGGANNINAVVVENGQDRHIYIINPGVVNQEPPLAVSTMDDPYAGTPYADEDLHNYAEVTSRWARESSWFARLWQACRFLTTDCCRTEGCAVGCAWCCGCCFAPAYEETANCFTYGLCAHSKYAMLLETARNACVVPMHMVCGGCVSASWAKMAVAVGQCAEMSNSGRISSGSDYSH